MPEASDQSRFAWPPRSTIEPSPSPIAPSSRSGPPPRQDEIPEFKPEPLSPHLADTHHRTDTYSASPRLAFERTFVGLLSPPWPIRAADANWRQDPDSAYCPRCAAQVGPHEVHGTPPSCSACREARLPWSRAVRLGPWTGPLRAAILEAKYARARRLAYDLGVALGHTLARRLRAADLNPAHTAILPIPMSFRRRWTRGLDHTLAIARGVRLVTRGPIRRPLRRWHRTAQASLPESGREINARGSFFPKSGEPLAAFAAVVVLDDVRTTGATLRAACRAIQARERRLRATLSSEQIWVATLAVVTPTDRRAPAGVIQEVEQDSREAHESLIV